VQARFDEIKREFDLTSAPSQGTSLAHRKSPHSKGTARGADLPDGRGGGGHTSGGGVGAGFDSDDDDEALQGAVTRCRPHTHTHTVLLHDP
jgi:hypothetical protein